MTETLPFWKRKTLAGMTRAEWESLCDGCGRCCLNKLREEDGPNGEPGRLHWTDVACRLLDTHSCRCSDYENRKATVPDCVKLTARKLEKIDWLPPSCAYRLVAEGKDLYWWHPLVSGDPETVHLAGASVQDKAVSERKAGALEDHIVTWPGRLPPRSARPRAPRKEPA
ncbi:YcgN family cysteine cluster protein [Acetobacteraceae bacterium H6797]|nr:YcgN family cysteine cluster protein [Acetobacteraceae bacterium H6797]